MSTATTTAERPSRERSERRAYWAMADSWTIALRELTHLTRQPSLIAWQLSFPIVSILLFVYVFGSAMEIGGGADYLSYAMPGMFAMTMAFGFMNTAFAVAVDKERGVMDRFRSMPMAPSAVVAGRGLSDVLHAGLDLLVLAVIAVVIGWRRPCGHPWGLRPAALAAVRPDLDRRDPRPRGQEPGGRRPAVRGRVPVRHGLQRLHPTVPDAGLAGCDRDVEPGLLDRERDPGAVRQPSTSSTLATSGTRGATTGPSSPPPASSTARPGA
jgi:ABC-2 type transporter